MTQRRRKTFGPGYRLRARLGIAISELRRGPRNKAGLRQQLPIAASNAPAWSSAPSASSSTAATWQIRAAISLALIVVDLGALSVTIGHVEGPVRVVLGLMLGAVIPGWSIVGLLRIGNPPLEIGLAVTVSFALLMVIAQLLMTVHAWHLGVLEEVTCVVCLPSLIWQSRGALTSMKRQHG